jgi:hypothetical protein
MLDERDATRLWQRLFRGQAITAQTLVEAESIVNNLRQESPLRLRFSQELEEIRALQNGQKTKGKR